jgi:hypothetical protein
MMYGSVELELEGSFSDWLLLLVDTFLEKEPPMLWCTGWLGFELIMLS